jgi:ABC-type transport system involved in multi-copper enzyme maturation permease subunit
MMALLRADWLRYRRRLDFWIIAIAVCILGSVTFLAAYHNDVTDPFWPTAAEIRQDVLGSTSFEGMTQTEIDQQIDQMVAGQVAQYDQQRAEFEANQAIALQKYDPAESPFTFLGSALAPIIALVLVGSLAIGDEFRYGTVRTSLLAAGNRRRFLAARLVSLLVMTVGLFVALAMLGAIFGLGLRAAGAEVSAVTTPVDPASALAWFAAQILTTMVVIALGSALTLLLRSGAMTLLLIVVITLAELFVAALPIFRQGEFLSGVPQVFLWNAIRTLTSRLGFDSHAVALRGGDLPPVAIDLPLAVVVAIAAAWGLLFLLVADRRLRTMDVVE